MHGRGGRRASSDESRGHSEVPACLRVHVCGPAAECLHYYALVSVCVSLSVCVCHVMVVECLSATDRLTST